MSAFYLKYRPQTISELDLEKVRIRLQEIVSAKSIPHALLFAGARGLGKTSAARIIAKTINCQDLQDGEPCNQCEICQSITNGSNLDVVEIDGASNRGIDDVRGLKESIYIASASLKYKVYIIDEVHMLSKEAFNAFLKILEEPPQNVLFIFATTEPHKIPETILSRVFRVDFQKAKPEEIKRALNRVIEGEKLDVNEGVLDEIIKLADGGFRDSVKFLEQLSFASQKIDLSTLQKVFPVQNLPNLFKILADKNASEVVQWFEEVQQDNVNWESLVREFLELLQSHLQSFYLKNDKDKLTFDKVETMSLINKSMRAGSQLRGSLIPGLPFKLAILEWLDADLVKKPKSPIKIDNKESSQSEERPEFPVKSDEKSDVAAENPLQTAQDSKPKTQRYSPKSIDENISNKSSQKPASFDLKKLKDKWPELLQAVKPYNHSVAALLKGASPEAVDDDYVTIKVYYQFHKERLEETKSQGILIKGFEEIFDYRPKFRYILGASQEKQKQEVKEEQHLAEAAEAIFS